MPMRITAVKREKRSRDRLKIYVDGELRLETAAEIAARNGVAAGAEVDEHLIAAIADQDLVWRAREAALNLLTHRPRTEQEIRDRLRRKQLPPAAIDQSVAEVKRLGLIDDRAYARDFARQRIRTRPRARHALIRELRAKGVDPILAKETVDEALRETDCSEAEIALLAARSFRRRPGEPPERARRRLTAFLARRGFAADAARDVLARFEL